MKWNIYLVNWCIDTEELDHDRLGGEWEAGREPVEDKEEDGEEEQNKEPDGGGVADKSLGDQNVKHPLDTSFLNWWHSFSTSQPSVFMTHCIQNDVQMYLK